MALYFSFGCILFRQRLAGSLLYMSVPSYIYEHLFRAALITSVVDWDLLRLTLSFPTYFKISFYDFFPN